LVLIESHAVLLAVGMFYPHPPLEPPPMLPHLIII
jgi:hypothetical protein